MTLGVDMCARYKEIVVYDKVGGSPEDWTSWLIVLQSWPAPLFWNIILFDQRIWEGLSDSSQHRTLDVRKGSLPTRGVWVALLVMGIPANENDRWANTSKQIHALQTKGDRCVAAFYLPSMPCMRVMRGLFDFWCLTGLLWLRVCQDQTFPEYLLVYSRKYDWASRRTS